MRSPPACAFAGRGKESCGFGRRSGLGLDKPCIDEVAFGEPCRCL